ncbi:abortive infection family protein [Gordonia sp. L191]|uniref:abortive infection family protein n=1 Tax=Gordonia sp. L191 TaxID=2982699 RepID=UPI0024BF9413|nr:abortive infection family protein [Gordonia sp. L191]WHU48692.1 abortive infection family protein [Gordonia sp. L191]
MSRPPISADIAVRFAQIYKYDPAVERPTHRQLTAVFNRYGFDDVAPYDPSAESNPNKEIRVRRVLEAVRRQPRHARDVVDALLVDLRALDCFTNGSIGADVMTRLQTAFKAEGFELTEIGELRTAGPIDLSTGGRAALDEQLARLLKADDDPALALGAAKDLLEAVAKFVLDEIGWPYDSKDDFSKLWHFARERLGLLPQQAASGPAQKQVQQILQSAWAIASKVSEIRNAHGTGHGRTLPTGVTSEIAEMVVREACSVAELVLTTLDRQLGRRP